jgi:di/tricarboxylate transporter
MATINGPAGHQGLDQPTNANLVLIGQVLCVLVPIVVWFAPLNLEPQTQHAFAIVSFMVLAWMTQAMDYALTGFVGCFLFWALGIVRFPVAFSGFANDTSWFLFGALLIGAIATRSGIARRIAYAIMLRVGITYPRILLGLILTDFLLTFVVPSGIARVVIMAAIVLWLTDFIHHISPAVIGIGVGLFALLPRVGILEIEEMHRLNYMPVFFVAAAVSMGTVMEQTKGIEVLTQYVLTWMQPFLGNIVVTTIVMYWTAFLYHFLLASEISMLATSIPLIMDLAKSGGFNPLQLGLIWTFAAGGKLFAYQSGVLIVGYSYGYFDARDLLRMGAWLTLVEFVILVLLVPFYWPLIGIH